MKKILFVFAALFAWAGMQQASAQRVAESLIDYLAINDDAELEKIAYAKSHAPIKTLHYVGTVTQLITPNIGISSHKNEHNTDVYFYSNGVIKQGLRYLLPSNERTLDGSTVYRLPGGDKNYENVAVIISNNQKDICLRNKIMPSRIIMADYYGLNGYNKAQYNNYTGYKISANSNMFIDNSSSSQSTSISSSQCRSCGGTGCCTLCGGRKQYWEETGLYTGNHTHTLVTCPSCNGSGNCKVCRGLGHIR